MGRRKYSGNVALIQGVSSTLQPDIVAYDTAAEAWQAMKDSFDKETPNNDIISLKNVLLNDFKIGQTSSITQPTSKTPETD